MAVWRWTVGGAALLVAYNLAIGTLAYGLRVDARDRALRDVEVTAATLSREIEAVMDKVDRTLSGVAEVTRAVPARLVATDAEAHRLLLRRHAITPELRSLFLVGGDGLLRNTSSVLAAPAIDLSDRDYFQAQQVAIRDAMFIGVPVRSRIDGRWLVPVSRAIEDSFGGLRAVVAAGLAPESLRHLIDDYRLGDDFRVAILLSNGATAACGGMAGCEDRLDVAAGPFVGDRASGGRMAYLPGGAGPGAFERGPRYGMVTVVAIADDKVLASWWRMVPVFVGLSTLGSAAMAVGLMVLRRQMLARRAAMDALAAANAELEARVADRTRELTASEDRLRGFVRATLDAVVIIDGKGTVTEFNPAASRLFGYDPAEIVGRSVNMLMPDGYARHHDAHVAAGNHPGQRPVGRERQMIGRRKDGSEFPIELTVGTQCTDGQVNHVGVIRDITERKANEDLLRRLANTDGLTGVFNRRSFTEEAERQFAIAQRHDRPLAVLMIDADHFKSVNDTHGHDVGDVVLKALAATIGGRLRETDVLGRLGGEEFAVLLPETDPDGAARMAWTVVEAVRQVRVPLSGDRALGFTVSVGVASRTAAEASFGGLLKQSDTALYQAKQGGRDRVVCFDGAAFSP